MKIAILNLIGVILVFGETALGQQSSSQFSSSSQSGSPGTSSSSFSSSSSTKNGQPVSSFSSFSSNQGGSQSNTFSSSQDGSPPTGGSSAMTVQQSSSQNSASGGDVHQSAASTSSNSVTGTNTYQWTTSGNSAFAGCGNNGSLSVNSIRSNNSGATVIPTTITVNGQVFSCSDNTRFFIYGDKCVVCGQTITEGGRFRQLTQSEQKTLDNYITESAKSHQQSMPLPSMLRSFDPFGSMPMPKMPEMRIDSTPVPCYCPCCRDQ